MVCEARIPSFDSFLPCDSPGVPFWTTNEAWPRVPRVGSTVATTTVTSTERDAAGNQEPLGGYTVVFSLVGGVGQGTKSTTGP